MPKGDVEAEGFIDWRKEYFEIMSQNTNDIEIIDPNEYFALRGDNVALFGALCLQIKESNLVVVNAESKLGAGTSMEMVISKYLNKPVITVLPKESAHRKSNLTFAGKEIKEWIHPFVESFSDIMVENISEFGDAVISLAEVSVKTMSMIDDSMEYARKLLNK